MIFENIDFTPFLISFKLAGLTTLILLILVIPLAWWLSQTESKIKPFIESIGALPIVLPPTVLGFYILYALSLNSPIGKFFDEFLGISLLFNFTGIVIASLIYSFPFMLQPLQAGFESLPKNIIEASYLSGKSQFTTLFRVALPNIKPSLFTGIIITFAHTVGEFGVVLMIGGSIPNETKVASIAIYEFVEIMDYKTAHIYSLIMIILSFLVLFVVYYRNNLNKLKS
jgi:molybdate transport system permease protein